MISDFTEGLQSAYEGESSAYKILVLVICRITELKIVF